MGATLILPSSNLIPDEYLHWVVAYHRKQKIADLEIIISNWGTRPVPIIDGLNNFICIGDDKEKVNVSKLRNAAVLSSNKDWLVLSDIDTVYHNPNTFKEMIYLANWGVLPVSAGKTRQDFLTRNDETPCGWIYPCNHGPIVIKKDLYLHVGGYCEQYSGWGLEDSDFGRKIGEEKSLSYSACGRHILEIHLCYMTNKIWLNGSDDNRETWNARLKKTTEDIIKEDRLQLGL